jgi:hypothetical protein
VIQKKIALIGVSGVGKASLVRRFVRSLFDEKYLTTLGMKVDKKQVVVGEQDLVLMVWDDAALLCHVNNVLDATVTPADAADGAAFSNPFRPSYSAHRYCPSRYIRSAPVA